MAKPPSRFSALEFEEHPEKSGAAAYIPLPRATGILVNDIEYPNLRAMLTTLREANADTVHLRLIVEATARILGVELDPWKPADDPNNPRTWASTIDPEWQKG